MKGISLLLSILLATALQTYAQFQIKGGSSVVVNGLMSVSGNVNNESTGLEMVSGHLNLTGQNQTLRSSTPVQVGSLTVGGGGIKTIQGEFTITGELVFNSGIVEPITGKLLYTGQNILSGSSGSYVKGTLYQRGSGTRFFPIGTGTAYMPMSLNGVTDGNAELGVTGTSGSAGLELPQDISSIAGNRYWEISANGGQLGASGASLYVPGSTLSGTDKLVVVESESLGGLAANLGGGFSGDFVTSFSAVSKPVLTIGKSEEVEVRIHDLITPYNGDQVNDKLKIVNVAYTVENKVTLLDRWGVVVKEWKNFRNYDDASNPNGDGYDFSRLSPGNYICVLEYKLSAGGPTQKKNQMITVLKGN